MEENLTANDLLQEAKEHLEQLRSGEVFIVKDLFLGYRWNRFPRNERLLLGTLFLNYIKTEQTERIVTDGKNGSNQQKYRVL